MVNDLVVDFIAHLQVENATYTYAIATCGGSSGHVNGYLKKLLDKQHLSLDYFAELIMPDNTVPYYAIGDEAQNRQTLMTAEENLKQIKEDIIKQTHEDIKGGDQVEMMRFVYHRMHSTRRFYVTEDCISCGKCEKICPVHANEIKGGRPAVGKSTLSKMYGLHQ
jgi:ferredoxin